MIEILWWVFFVGGFALLGVATRMHQYEDTKLSMRGYLYSASAFVCFGMASALYRNVFAMSWNAGFLAWCLWQWWNGGGGDGLKRRLKKLSSSFGLGPRLAGQSA